MYFFRNFRTNQNLLLQNSLQKACRRLVTNLQQVCKKLVSLNSITHNSSFFKKCTFEHQNEYFDQEYELLDLSNKSIRPSYHGSDWCLWFKNQDSSGSSKTFTSTSSPFKWKTKAHHKTARSLRQSSLLSVASINRGGNVASHLFALSLTFLANLVASL